MQYNRNMYTYAKGNGGAYRRDGSPLGKRKCQGNPFIEMKLEVEQ